MRGKSPSYRQMFQEISEDIALKAFLSLTTCLFLSFSAALLILSGCKPEVVTIIAITLSFPLLRVLYVRVSGKDKDVPRLAVKKGMRINIMGGVPTVTRACAAPRRRRRRRRKTEIGIKMKVELNILSRLLWSFYRILEYYVYLVDRHR
jgi:hypothetical protein